MCSTQNFLHNSSSEEKIAGGGAESSVKTLNLRKKTGLVFLGVLISFFLIEILLRIHNPFFRLSRGRIKLPVYASYHLDNKVTSLLDLNIIHTKNSLGFRGMEFAEARGKYKIIAVGGSTTECFYLSDGDPWVAHLEKKLNQDGEKYWVNNAGLGGHTSYGHFVLLREHIFELKPDLILMLVGINDVGNEIHSRWITNNHKEEGSWKNLIKRGASHSEALDTGINFFRFFQATQKGLIDKPFKRNLNEHTSINLEARRSQLKKHKQKYITAYRNRIEQIVDACGARNIELVLITQAAPYGRGSDPHESINLVTVVVMLVALF